MTLISFYTKGGSHFLSMFALRMLFFTKDKVNEYVRKRAFAADKVFIFVKF